MCHMSAFDFRIVTPQTDAQTACDAYTQTTSSDTYVHVRVETRRHAEYNIIFIC